MTKKVNLVVFKLNLFNFGHEKLRETRIQIRIRVEINKDLKQWQGVRCTSTPFMFKPVISRGELTSLLLVSRLKEEKGPLSKDLKSKKTLTAVLLSYFNIQSTKNDLCRKTMGMYKNRYTQQIKGLLIWVK